MIKLRESDSDDGSMLDLAPDLTSLLDILFILLVFFMLTAGAAYQALNLKLPYSLSRQLPLINEPEHIMLEIRENTYALNGKTINDFNTLKAMLPGVLNARPKQAFIIAGDKRISIEKFLKVLTYLQSQGVETANILMQNETQK